MISATERSGIVSHAPSTVSPAVSRALNFLTRLTPPSVARSVILISTPPQGVGSLRHGRGHGQPAGVRGAYGGPGCARARHPPTRAVGAAWRRPERRCHEHVKTDDTD